MRNIQRPIPPILNSLKERVPIPYRNVLKQALGLSIFFIPVLRATVRHFGAKNVRLGTYSASWGKFFLVSVSKEVWVSTDALTAANPDDVAEATAYLEGPLAIENFWLSARSNREEVARLRELERHEKNLRLVQLDPREFVLAIGFDDKGNIRLEDGDTRLTILKYHKIKEAKAVVVVPVWWRTPE